MQNKNQSIKTFVRIRPLNIFENQKNKCFWKKDSKTIVSKNNDQLLFDAVFDDTCTNQQIYNQTTKTIIEDSFNGFHSCILAYGQTSSGKTYTMKGTQQIYGIIPLTLNEIFTKIQKENINARVTIIYLQIYNQDVIDLLSDIENVKINIQIDHKSNLSLQNVTQVQVKNVSQAMSFFNKGQIKRKFASNNVNDMSSRSHVIFRINLQIINEKFNRTNSQINLVDLAGSQSIDKTKGQKLLKTEGENINKSLLALQKVIKQMTQKNTRDGKRFVNFRDSKLTRILQKSLFHNSKSTIICTINPTQNNYSESINTLKFGSMAQKIRIEAKQNMIRSQMEIKDQVEFTQYNQKNLLPTQKLKLEELERQTQDQKDQLNQLREKCKVLEEDNYQKLDEIGNLNKYLSGIKSQLEHRRNSELENTQTLLNKINYQTKRINQFQVQLNQVQKEVKSLRLQKRILQKNQKGLSQNLQHYQNQCRTLNKEIHQLRNKMIEENSKNKKITRLSQSNKYQNKQKKPNYFFVPPYQQRPNEQRIPSIKISAMIMLKTQLIDLRRQLNEYTKAHSEICDQNEELKKRLQEMERQDDRATGKVNPASLQGGQIRKLQRKIKNLQNEIKIIKQRERKNRQYIKRKSEQNLAQLEEYEQFHNKKYSLNNMSMSIGIQYPQEMDNLQYKNTNNENENLYISSKKVERENNGLVEKHMHRMVEKQNNSLQEEKLQFNLIQSSQIQIPEDQLMFKQNNSIIKNQNPEEMLQCQRSCGLNANQIQNYPNQNQNFENVHVLPLNQYKNPFSSSQYQKHQNPLNKDNKQNKLNTQDLLFEDYNEKMIPEVQKQYQI